MQLLFTRQVQLSRYEFRINSRMQITGKQESQSDATADH